MIRRHRGPSGRQHVALGIILATLFAWAVAIPVFAVAGSPLCVSLLAEAFDPVNPVVTSG